MRRVAMVALAALMASGCATSKWRSQELVPLGSREAAEVSALVTERLAAAFPPGRTTFELSPVAAPPGMGFLPFKNYETFGRALEKALRQRGFGVAVPSGASGPYPKLVYVLDDLEPEQAYRIGVSVDSEYRLDGVYGLGASNFGLVNWTARNGADWNR